MAFSTINNDLSARFQVRHGLYVGPGAYVAGGDYLTIGCLAQAGLGRVEAALLSTAMNALGTVIYILRYNPLTDKIMWFDLTGTEVVAGVDLSTFSAYYLVYGI